VKGKRGTVHLLSTTIGPGSVAGLCGPRRHSLCSVMNTVATTQIYLEATLEMKEQALAKNLHPPATPYVIAQGSDAELLETGSGAKTMVATWPALGRDELQLLPKN